MTKKENNKAPEAPLTKEEKERELLEKHPFETMSQIQNRYGNGREQNGSDGSSQDARGTNH